MFETFVAGKSVVKSGSIAIAAEQVHTIDLDVQVQLDSVTLCHSILTDSLYMSNSFIPYSL